MYPILVMSLKSFIGYYLDFVNFGKRNELPPNLPRILYWKGSMINKYASYDRVSGEKYGKRPVSVVFERFYDKKICPVSVVLLFRLLTD